jgi:hypothetical protein
MQQRGIPAGFILGVFLSCYMLLFGCSSINSDFAKSIETLAVPIVEDYKRVLNERTFEGFTLEERKQHIDTRERSCDELLLKLKEAQK